MAPDEAPRAKPHALESTVSLHGLKSVLRAAGCEPTARREARRNPALVAADQGDQEPGDRGQCPSENRARSRKQRRLRRTFGGVSGLRRRGHWALAGGRLVHEVPTQPTRSSRKLEKVAAYASFRARISKSRGPWRCWTSRRQISPSRRRKRLRATAVDWNLGTISPIRGWPAVLSIQMNSRNRDLRRRPASRTRVRSARDARRLDCRRRSLVVSGSRAWSRY